MTGSKSNTLIASFGLLMSCCSWVIDQIIGSGSLESGEMPSAAHASIPGTASNGLPESHFRKRRRLTDAVLPCVMTSSLCGLFDLQPSTFRERRETLCLALDESVEFVRRTAFDLDAELLEPAVYIGHPERPIHSCIQFLDHSPRRLCRRTEAHPA